MVIFPDAFILTGISLSRASSSSYTTHWRVYRNQAHLTFRIYLKFIKRSVIQINLIQFYLNFNINIRPNDASLQIAVTKHFIVPPKHIDVFMLPMPTQESRVPLTVNRINHLIEWNKISFFLVPTMNHHTMTNLAVQSTAIRQDFWQVKVAHPCTSVLSVSKLRHCVMIHRGN